MVNPVRSSGRGMSGLSPMSTDRLRMSPPSRRLLPVAAHTRSLANAAVEFFPSSSAHVRSVIRRASTGESMTVPSARLSKMTVPTGSASTEVIALRSSSFECVQVRTRWP